ncbi:MAG: DNA polymerase III subunit alpha [Verrucomicrobia bacterium]|nr:MAG: DNA polymerase III subunit alpha [Verrucomicrobiota bacterium]
MFTELYARSSFSFLRGASHPQDLIQRAAELNYKSIAILDHMGVYGSVQAHLAARRHGIRALVGATVELPGGRPGGSPLEIPVLVDSIKGYQNLCHLLTNLHCHSEAISPDALSRNSDPSVFFPSHPEGMIALLTPESLPSLDRRSLLRAALLLRRTFGRHNIYITLTRHYSRSTDRINRLLIDLAQSLSIPLLASNAPLFSHRRCRLLADCFTCLRHHTTLDEAGTLLASNSERHLKSPDQMSSLFSDQQQALINTEILSERLAFTLDDLEYQFPSYHENGKSLTREEEARLLRKLTFLGARNRYGKIGIQVRKQLEHELSLIIRLRFSGYFLIVWEIVEFAKSQGILCQGRGSAANSAVCYCLGITACDPVGGGLLFERFLSENRRSWPDIDIDFPSGGRREAVIQHVFQKYAPRGAAMTANVITYRPKSAFREISKVLGLPDSIAARFSSLISSPHSPDTPGERPNPSSDAGKKCNTAPAAEEMPDGIFPMRDLGQLTKTLSQSGLSQDHPRFKPLMHLYHEILSFPRHLGQHSGGMIICDTGLDSIVPLQPASMPDRTIVQWDKDDCEELGIVKVDLLGLGMLAAMEDSLRICRQRGKSIDLAHIPYDDAATFDLLCRADTVGTFQVESRAQMATLPLMQPRGFYDLVIEIALIRPGPIVGELVHPYLNRRSGRTPVDYIHPDFQSVLARTLGVPLFQEQVLRMAMIIAGFDGAEADELRRAMAFKRSDERMETIVEKLRSRMSHRHINPAVQEKVIRSISSFALYGFPESHAISFALLAYASCWLKTHHTAEFFTGLLNNQPMGFYPVASLLHDARRHGIHIKPVSVIHSSLETSVIDDKTLRLGLQHLKNISSSTTTKLLEARSHTHFIDLADFLRRVQPNKKERRLLAAAGSLDDLPGIAHRRDALWQGEHLPQEDLLSRCNNSPLSDSRAATPEIDCPLLPMSDFEKLTADYHSQGYSTGSHPMALLRKSWIHKFQNANSPSQQGDYDSPINPSLLSKARDFKFIPHGQHTICAGLVICRQRPSTAKGHCFISLEDETGTANLFIPCSTFLNYRLVITTEKFLLCHGRMQIGENDSRTLYTTSLEPLPLELLLETESHDFH